MAMVQDLGSFLDREIVYGDCSFILITELGLADSCFLVGHLVARHLLAGRGVCLLSTTRTGHHYQHLCGKLGVSLESYRENGQLVVVDGLKVELDLLKRSWETDGGSSDAQTALVTLYERTKEAIGQWTDRRPFFLVIDDVSVWIRLGFSTREVIAFVQGCRSLTDVPDACLTLVFGEEVDDQNLPRSDLCTLLAHWCDLKLNVAHLATGHSTEVHGQLAVTWRNRALKSTGKVATSDFHFKVEEKRVWLFAPGTSPAVL